MKEFAKRTVTSALVAAMMLSCVSPAFAEGSKEFNAKPDSTTTSDTQAHRPYFEWRQRMQFGEAGKNVFYVYAQKGETIFFGSDITKASDRSIEAIVHPEVDFQNTISSNNKNWAGASIAVTLPVSDTEAFNPEKENWYNKTEIENLFLDGSDLKDGCSNKKVYLFKPAPSGKGHILTPSQESKGPNTGTSTDGYEPLSFVAPVEGTYSFRFLAKDYNYEDVPHTEFEVANRNEPAGKVDQNTVLSPVPESYTWDFANMKSGGTYTGNTIVGYGYDSSNGTDYDHYYYYDIEAQANNRTQITTSNGSLTLPSISNNNISGDTYGALELLPAWAGEVSVNFSRSGNSGSATVYINQPNKSGNTKSTSKSSDNSNQQTTVSFSVEANKPVYIYSTSKAAKVTSVSYTVTNPPTGAARKIDEQWSTSIPAVVAAWDITVAKKGNNNTYTAQPGRVWIDRLVLNAGGFKTSIYPQPKVLTKEGFLYAVNLNGIQPWAFSFYSNNRGFLLDRWSLYSKPQLVYGENAQPSTVALQALEHSFFSKPVGGSGDMGPAPIRKEVDGDGGQVIYNGNQMESTILANHIPVDPEKDETHKLFFNEPDSVALKAYTEEGNLKEIKDVNEEYSGLLNNIKYTGLGNFADNESSDTHYGTIGIGGEFEVTISKEEAQQLNTLGSSSISILLDFSGYQLKDDKNGVPVPVLTGDKKWKPISGTQTEDEKNNLVSLSTVIDNDATETKTYKLSWDGRDAYGNVVPQGEYSQVIKSFVELGMAHFPILDVEHNPNGIKIKMLNEIEGNELTSDRVYYNNEAVSPRVNPEDPSAWYYSGDLNLPYPSKIGDGFNRTGGISTNFDKPSEKGVMVFGQYSNEDGGNDAGLGYGNSTALDIWSKYEIKANAVLKIGVAPIKPKHSYVSFVATNGTANINGTPFDVSHVEFAGNRELAKASNKGKDDTYGNTISTGFITDVSTTAEGIANDRLVWEITIPVTGKINDNDVSTHDTYIKIPADDLANEKATFTSQEDADEAEYLSYELFSSLFEDFENDEEINIGEEAMPDWEIDADFNGDEEPGMVDIPDNTEYEEIALSEEMYYEVMELEAVNAGDYKDNDWTVTMNAEPTAVLEDANGVQVNKGDIHKINGFKIDDRSTTDYVTIKVAHKIPTTITGGSVVTVGLIIDNLYAPAATATAKYSSSGWDSLHEITSILFGGSNTDSVQASSSEEYSTSSRNEYNIEGYEDIDILKLGLLMHITFDENGTNSKSFEATYGGTVSVNNQGESITYPSGKHGKAVNMTGDLNDSLELPKGLFNGLSSTSVSFWIKDTNTANTNGWAFITTPAGKQTYMNEKYFGALSAPEKIIVERYYSTNQNRPATASVENLNFDDWTHITINFEYDTFSVYVNGKLSAGPINSIVTPDKLFTDNARTWIGHANWNDTNEGFTGMIDDFRIYNRPLSESEIQTLMNAN